MLAKLLTLIRWKKRFQIWKRFSSERGSMGIKQSWSNAVFLNNEGEVQIVDYRWEWEKLSQIMKQKIYEKGP